MREELKAFIIIAIKNILVLAGFVVLAIVFNKWWITLLALLFWSSVKIETKDEKEKE